MIFKLFWGALIYDMAIRDADTFKVTLILNQRHILYVCALNLTEL